MKTPDRAPDELVRLQTLRSLNILDTEPEERFDRITRMAKRLFDVPIALVSLVDENRQWFKSRAGLDTSETPRDISFCGHVILQEDVFIVPDASCDIRFADNPLVTDDPNIAFYAGCPLRAPNGQQVGALCIIDHVPRNLDGDEAQSLVDLASMVEKELAAVELATTDELSCLLNRRGFHMLGEHTLQICKREKIAATLLFMDLDNLKPINDQFGHAEGDSALSIFAHQMCESFRSSDIVARLGGDEFAILLTNAATPEASEVVERFSASLEQAVSEADKRYAISFSYGLVEFDPAVHASIDTLLAEGDALMYAEKSSKRRFAQ